MNKIKSYIKNLIDIIIFGKTHQQMRSELIVIFGEVSVNKAEVATSKYVGAVTTRILRSPQFKATCYAYKQSEKIVPVLD